MPSGPKWARFRCHFREWTNLARPFVIFTWKVRVQKEQIVHLDMFEATKPSFANIGFVGCVKKAMGVNFCMNMTCPKCPSATFTQDLVSDFTYFLFNDLLKLRFLLHVQSFVCSNYMIFFLNEMIKGIKCDQAEIHRRFQLYFSFFPMLSTLFWNTVLRVSFGALSFYQNWVIRKVFIPVV